MSDAAPQDDPRPDLWETARQFCRWLVALCGSPSALVAGGWLPVNRRREIGFWLRPVEALVRRLLVIEAARIARASGSTARRDTLRRPGRAPFCRVAFLDPRDSTGWTVRFSVHERPRPGRGPAAARTLPRLRNLESEIDILAPARLAFAAAEHRRHLEARCNPAPPECLPPRPRPSRAAGNPWKLARRIEALIRVLENPMPHARRLARQLRNDAAPFIRLCRPPAPPPPGKPPPYGDAPVREASGAALSALAPFDPG